MDPLVPGELDAARRDGILQALAILAVPPPAEQPADALGNVYGAVNEFVFDPEIDGKTRLLRFWSVLNGLAEIWRHTCDTNEIELAEALEAAHEDLLE